MTMPGFNAEASVYRNTGSYRTGLPAPCSATDRIVPMWQIPDCSGILNTCENRCNSVILAPDLTEYDACMSGCGNDFTACLEAHRTPIDARTPSDSV